MKKESHIVEDHKKVIEIYLCVREQLPVFILDKLNTEDKKQ